jgi:hypothetical protein
MPRIPIPLIGPSLQGRSTYQQSGRTINLYPVLGGADAKAVVALHGTPGYATAIDLSDQFPAGTDIEVRGFHRVGYDRLFFVANERIYEVLDLDAGTFALWAELQTFTGQVGMSDNAGYLVLGDNSYWTLNLADGAGTATLQPVLNDGEEQLLGWFPRWVDGVTIYPHRNSGQFSWSALGDPTTIDGLDFATAEGDPDNINQCLVMNRQILFIGGRSVEFFEYTGNTEGNAVERIGGGFQQYGIGFRYSAVSCGNFAVWIGRHNNGEGQVIALGNAGQEPVRISTDAVEADIGALLHDRVEQDEVTAFYYEDFGHRFYVLNLPAQEGSYGRAAKPSKTWVYDFTTQMWHERAYRNPATGLFERIKAEHHTLWFGKHLVSTYDDAALLYQNLDLYADVGGVPLIRQRESAGPLSMQGRSFRVNRLGIEMEVGVGLDGSGQGTDPKLMLAYSWDAGKTWSNEMMRDIGKLGKHETTVEFGPCGMGKNFVIRTSISDPIRVVLTGAWADVEVGR